VVGATLTASLGVVRPKGWSGHPQKAKKKKKKNQKMGFGLLDWGWSSHPCTDCKRWPKPSLGHKSPKPIFVFFFIIIFLAFWGWPDHPLGHGDGSTTPRPAMRVVGFGQKWGGRTTPFWRHPRFYFLSFFFFFFFYFLFL
jgi:hypothetical protein